MIYLIYQMKEKERENKMRCFHCPLKFHCALVLWDAWNVNLEMCNCTNDKLVCLDNPFRVDQKLLEEWKKGNPMPLTYEYLGKTHYVNEKRPLILLR